MQYLVGSLILLSMVATNAVLYKQSGERFIFSMIIKGFILCKNKDCLDPYLNLFW